LVGWKELMKELDLWKLWVVLWVLRLSSSSPCSVTHPKGKGREEIGNYGSGDGVVVSV